MTINQILIKYFAIVLLRIKRIGVGGEVKLKYSKFLMLFRKVKILSKIKWT